MKKIFAVAAPALALAHASLAYAIGSVQHLNPAFGNAGFVTESAYRPRAILRQADGMLVVGGNADDDFVVARYTSAGTLDSTFGSGGIARVDLTGGEDLLFAIAIQSDGKIVAVGEAEVGGEERLGAIRLAINGTLDTSFGTSGIVVEDVSVEAYDVAIQPNGALVIVGKGEVPVIGGPGTTGVAALARLDGSGAFDPSFGDGGVVQMSFPPDQNTELWGVALQNDGKIIASGVDGGDVVQQDFLIARFLTDGSLDTSFGDGGSVRTEVSPIPAQDIAWDVAIQPDGKIVAAGGYYPFPNRVGFALARYLADGSLDASFGENGLVRTAFSLHTAEAEQSIGGYHGAYGRGMEIMADGRIVLAGDSVVGRYLADGSQDPSFGGGTISTLLPDASVPAFSDVALQPDGTVVTVGNVFDGPSEFTVSGLLVGFAPCDCPACEACDGLGGCVAAPQTGCFRGDKTSVSFKNSTDDSRDGLNWKLSFGDAVPPVALGLPYETTDYALCVYDESGPEPVVALRAYLPAGTECGGERCWRTAGNEASAKYRNDDVLAGLTGSASVKAGALYKSAARVKAKGAALAMPALTLGTPLRVQLQIETGQCWEMVYDAADVVRSSSGLFKAATDSLDN